MAYNAHPDMIIRENEMDVYLRALALQTGYSSSAKVAAEPSHTPSTLDEVYDDQIEALAQTAYATDYTTFGFGKFKRTPSQAKKTTTAYPKRTTPSASNFG